MNRVRILARKPKPLRRGHGDAFGLIVCGAWALVLCYASGMRGFFAMDQSIVFDGGWRILQGQIPFVDFFLPHGPLSMWIQAGAFALCGVSYRVYVMTAASMNVLGACLAYASFRIMAPEIKWPAWAAGILTGSWLYAPMGTTYIEQTGFVLLWVGIFAVVRGIGLSGWGRKSWMAVAGLALAASILAKTNTGILAVPFLFLMPVFLPKKPAQDWGMDWLSLGAGLVLGLGAFGWWLIQASEPAAFQHYVLEIAGREGRRRVLENKEFHFIVCSLFNGKGNDLVRLWTVAAYTLLGLGLTLARGPWKHFAVATPILRYGSLGLLWIAYQQVFGITSNNNGINEQPLIGLITVCVFLVISEMAKAAGQRVGAHSLLLFLRRATAYLLPLAMAFTVFFYAKGIRGMGNFDFALGVLLAFAVLTWLLFAPGRHGAWKNLSLACGGGLVVGALFGIGAWGSYSRQAQDFFNAQTRFIHRPGIPGLQGLAWAEGVNADAREMYPTWPELMEIWTLFRESPGRFYLLGNHTFLYALTGKPSVGPLSWFFKGLTYPNKYDRELDRKFAASVDQQDMLFFVTEEDFGLKGKLADFPLLHRVLRTRYRPEKKIGFFMVYRRIPSGQASAPGGSPPKFAPASPRGGR